MISAWKVQNSENCQRYAHSSSVLAFAIGCRISQIFCWRSLEKQPILFWIFSQKPTVFDGHTLWIFWKTWTLNPLGASRSTICSESTATSSRSFDGWKWQLRQREPRKRGGRRRIPFSNYLPPRNRKQLLGIKSRSTLLAVLLLFVMHCPKMRRDDVKLKIIIAMMKKHFAATLQRITSQTSSRR